MNGRSSRFPPDVAGWFAYGFHNVNFCDTLVYALLTEAVSRPPELSEVIFMRTQAWGVITRFRVFEGAAE